jgi:hypothetical protein
MDLNSLPLSWSTVLGLYVKQSSCLNWNFLNQHALGINDIQPLCNLVEIPSQVPGLEYRNNYPRLKKEKYDRKCQICPKHCYIFCAADMIFLFGRFQLSVFEILWSCIHRWYTLINILLVVFGQWYLFSSPTVFQATLTLRCTFEWFRYEERIVKAIVMLLQTWNQNTDYHYLVSFTHHICVS